MTRSISKLVELAKGVRPTPAQQEEQRRSFAYGNTRFENENVTREIIDRQADAMKAEGPAN